MKASYIFVIAIIVSAALGIGWFFDSRSIQLTQNTLEVPDNIDYYLSNLKYRSMNKQGSLHYQLQSPYLEHYIQQDTSHLQQPTLQFYGEESEWYIQAETGRLQHKEEQFSLQQQVRLQKKSTQQPLLLTSNLLILKVQNNLIEIPQDMQLTSSNLNLKAASAVIDMDKKLYQFTRVNATIKPNNDSRTSNEQS